MLRSRLSSFVAVRLLGAEPIGEGDFGGTDLAGAIWRRRFGGGPIVRGGPIVCRVDFARPDDGAPLFEGLKICSEFAYMHKKSYICI